MAASGTALEKELKYRLNEHQYHQLLAVARHYPSKTCRQVNYYFDDPKLRLRKKKIGLRIRILNGKQAVVTLKVPARGRSKKVPSLKIRHEYDAKIPLQMALAILAGKKKISDLKIRPINILKKRLSGGTVKRILPLGAVRTVRTKVQCDRHLELEIDRCQMFSHKFYELEVETEEPEVADRCVRLLLSSHGIPCVPTTKSKLGRFLDEWKKNRNSGKSSLAIDIYYHA